MKGTYKLIGLKINKKEEQFIKEKIINELSNHVLKLPRKKIEDFLNGGVLSLNYKNITPAWNINKTIELKHIEIKEVK